MDAATLLQALAARLTPRVTPSADVLAQILGGQAELPPGTPRPVNIPAGYTWPPSTRYREPAGAPPDLGALLRNVPERTGAEPPAQFRKPVPAGVLRDVGGPAPDLAALLRNVAEQVAPAGPPPGLPISVPGPTLPPPPTLQAGPSPIAAWAGGVPVPQPSNVTRANLNLADPVPQPLGPASPQAQLFGQAAQTPFGEPAAITGIPGGLGGPIPGMPSGEGLLRALVGATDAEAPPKPAAVPAAPAARPSPLDALVGSLATKPVAPTTQVIDLASGKIQSQLPGGWPPALGAVPVGSGIGAAQPSMGGLDSYLNQMYGAESGNRNVPNQAGASSASGWAQFTDSTWLDTVRRNDPETWKGLGGDKAKVLALRNDENYHKTMARAFTQENAGILNEKGLPVNNATLYAMHFFGQGDGPKVIGADPTTPLSSLVGEDKIAANPQLKGKTAGEALQWAGQTIGGGRGTGGMALPQDFAAPRLPTPPEVQALKTGDPSAYEKFNALQVVRPPAMTQGDRLTNILASMAQGAQGTKNLGDFLLGAGGGALGGAAKLTQQARAEDLAAAQARQQLDILQAGKGIEHAGAVAAAANAPIQAANINAQNKFQRDLDQAKLDAEAKNKAVEQRGRMDILAMSQGVPHVAPSNDGTQLTITRWDPRAGTVSVSSIPMQGGENSVLAHARKAVKDAEGALGPDNPLLPAIKAKLYFAEGMTRTGSPEGGKQYLLAQGINETAQSGILQQVLQEQTPQAWKEIDRELTKGTTTEDLTSGAKGAQKRAQRLAELVLGRMANEPRLASVITGGILNKTGGAGAGAYFGLYQGLR